MDARATYEAGRTDADARLKVQESKITALGTTRLVVALAALALVGGLVWGHLPDPATYVVVALVAGFIVLVVVHARAFAAKERAEAALRFYERGLSRLDGTWRAFPSKGTRYASVDHPYTDDLDIFGPSSLFQLLNATQTPFGHQALGEALQHGGIEDDGPPTLTWDGYLRLEQEAVRELSDRVTWREQLSVEGEVLRSDKPDPEPFLAWATGKSDVEVPSFVVMLALALPLLVALTAFGATRLGLPKSSWLLVVLVEMAISARYRELTAPTIDAVSAHAGGFAKYAPLFRVALSEPRKSDRLGRLVGCLGAGAAHGGVVREMRSLERIVSFVEARRNEVFRLFLGPVLMWDLNCAIRLERWRRRCRADVTTWFSSLGQLEAFASLAGFAFDRPDHAWPEPQADARLAATSLGHPLIDAGRRIGNDVELPGAGTVMVVTGSNMSGKSTLLRALGVNLVLARVGAPVAAKSFTFGFVAMATSMRIRDSLEDGVSHFYAELKKLKKVVDLAQPPVPLLFLLDEILHGTNSRERVIGARAVIKGLMARGALGAVSTHDLGIADLASEVKEGVTNVHFEEQVNDDGTMTFDYQLRKGPVQSSNALRLMRAIGLEVPLETET